MKNINIQFGLPVSILKEGDSFVAYTPALDLSTSGVSFEDAQKNFIEAVNIFFEELIAMGTINEVLAELGWQKDNDQFIPPIVVSNQTEKFSIPFSN